MQEGIVFADIDLRDIGSTRREWTFLRDRRPEVYGEVAGSSWQRGRSAPRGAVSTRKGKRAGRGSERR
jgi:hypothetical protein